MARQAGLDRDFGRFQVTDLAHQHHVRILTQNGTQASSKGQFNLGIDLCLPDAVEIILDRIFHRHDIATLVVQTLQHGIQGGGLAGTRRPGDQYDAMRFADHAVH